MSLLSMCLDVTFLSLGVKVYQQVQGTAIESPVSVVAANQVMKETEEKPYPPSTPLSAFGSIMLIEVFHDHLNSIESCVQFTDEKESHGKLAFLDVQIARSKDGTISTSVFQKATHMNQCLSFDSHYPPAHKVALVRTLMTRADALSSSGVELVV